MSIDSFYLRSWILLLGILRCVGGLVAYFNNEYYTNHYLNDKKINPFACRNQGVWYFSLGVVNIVASFYLHIYSTSLICLLTYIIGCPTLINEFLNHKTMKIHSLNSILFIAISSIIALSYHLLTYDFKY